jgi:hypothetical protein
MAPLLDCAAPLSLLLLLLALDQTEPHAQSKTQHMTTRHALEIQQRQARYYDNNAFSINIPRSHDERTNIEGEIIEKRAEADEVWPDLRCEGNYFGGPKSCDNN